MNAPAPLTFSCLLACLALLCGVLPVAAPAQAGPIYKCTSPHGGAVTFQDQPCASGSHQARIRLAPPPAGANPSRVADAAPSPAARSSRHPRGRRAARTRVVQSWECRVANGEVFYRHSACPATVSGPARAVRRKRQYGGSRVIPLAVTGRAIPRTDACRAINATTASDRFGHARDEQVSTYERNAGNDPCRRY
jgi:hypothetical protein